MYRAFALLLLVLVACTPRPSQEIIDLEARALIAREEARHQVALAHNKEIYETLQSIYRAGAIILTIGFAGLVWSLVRWAWGQSVLIRPGRDGQMPIVNFTSGGVSYYVDLNRIGGGVIKLRGATGLKSITNSFTNGEQKARTGLPRRVNDLQTQQEATYGAQVLQAVSAATRNIPTNPKTGLGNTIEQTQTLLNPYRPPPVKNISVPVINKPVKASQEIIDLNSTTLNTATNWKSGTDVIETKTQHGTIRVSRHALRQFVKCPTPSRRLEWTGDAQTYKLAAAFCITHHLLTRLPNNALSWIETNLDKRLAFIEGL